MGNTKFRIGDKVRVVGVCDHRSSYNGVVFVIRSINPNGVYGATKEHYSVHSDDVYCSYVFYVDELILVEKKPFTKVDLKNGMIIEHRDGDKYMVIDDRLVQEEGFFRLSDYNEDLTDKQYKEYDIVKVYKPITDRIFDTSDLFSTDNLDLVWERKEEVVKEMTVAEIEEKLGYKVKIVDGDSK